MKGFPWRKLLIVGLGLVVGGFFYDVRFAGIPYQDASAEMMADYQRHSGIARVICLSGGMVMLVGVAGIIGRLVVTRFQKEAR